MKPKKVEQKYDDQATWWKVKKIISLVELEYLVKKYRLTKVLNTMKDSFWENFKTQDKNTKTNTQITFMILNNNEATIHISIPQLSWEIFTEEWSILKNFATELNLKLDAFTA